MTGKTLNKLKQLLKSNVRSPASSELNPADVAVYETIRHLLLYLLNHAVLTPDGKIPGMYDDIEEYDSVDNLPQPGESGKMYSVDGELYVWDGTEYKEAAGKDVVATLSTHVSNGGIHVGIQSVPVKTINDTWTCTPPTTSFGTPFSVKWTIDATEGEGWALFTNDTKQGKVFTDADADTLTWSRSAATSGYDVTAVRVPSQQGYTINSGSSEKFQPAGDYATAKRLEKLASDVITKAESISWENLKALRRDGNLVPGKHYRIIDYVATVANDANVQSANHPFNIIVVADSTNTLNEHARAVIHEGNLPDDVVDGSTRTKYFASCDLAAWDVWYCLDNDTARFTWADATNGKGVIYRLVDEFRNDCPYDFKGIQFKAYGDTDNVWRYTFDSGVANNNTDYSLARYNIIYANKINPYFDFDNRQKLNHIVFKGSSCRGNTFDANCYQNTFGSGCYYNTFGSECFFNRFGSDCYSNTFDTKCSSNTFGSECYSNTFGSECYSNTFGSGCSYNTFGSSCRFNKFGSYCYDNTFGSDCYSNTFDTNCSSNTFGPTCYYNTFGDYCDYNTFGSGCYSNTFGPCCYVGNWTGFAQRYAGTVVSYDDNILHVVRKRYHGFFSTSKTYLAGETVYRNSQYYECTTDHTGEWIEEHFLEVSLVGGILSTEAYTPLSFYRHVELENGVSYVALDCTDTRGDSVYYQDVTVTNGIGGTESAPKHIEDSNSNQSHKTTYQLASSEVISLSLTAH